MDYKKKLKSRLYIAVIYIALGVMMIAGTAVIKTDNRKLTHSRVGLLTLEQSRIR